MKNESKRRMENLFQKMIHDKISSNKTGKQVCQMGVYLNPGNDKFYKAINSEIYVDKTGLIKQLLNEHGLVNLFTRTRRFGKSLNMSMLKYFFEIFEQTKKWYDGYRFGNTDIYCPWDVINHCRALKIEPDATPQPYWINTSGNYIVKRFIEKANQQTRREIQKEIRLELTYNELDSTIENLWSVLFATGYLTKQGKPQEKTKTA